VIKRATFAVSALVALTGAFSLRCWRARVHLIILVALADGSTRLPVIPQDVRLLYDLIARTHAKLVVVDPIAGYLDSKIDSHNDASVRGAFNLLHAVAQETSAAVVCVRHFTKDSKETNPLYRGGGSIAMTGFARSALAILPDPDPQQLSRRYFGRTKNNLDKTGAPLLAYEVESRNDVIAGEPVSLSKITWSGSDNRSVKQLLQEAAQSGAGGAPMGAGRAVMAECFALLETLLADGEEHGSAEIDAEIDHADISDYAYKQCRKQWTKSGRLITRKRGGEVVDEKKTPFYWVMKLKPVLEVDLDREHSDVLCAEADESERRA
jgi:hypothetical protein